MRHLVLAILLTFALPASADVTDPVAAAIADGNTARLQAAFEDMLADARTKRDGDILVDSFERHFSTTHPGTWDTVIAWEAAYPASPFAKSALAWMTMRRAFLLRGNRYVSRTPAASLEAFRENAMEATDLALAANGLAPEFPPAVTTLAYAYRAHVWQGDIGIALDTVMGSLPSKATLQAALLITDPRWGGGGPGAIESVCIEYAPRIDGYAPEACMVEAILTTLPNTEAGGWAWHMLDQLDEPRLEYWARKWAMMNADTGRLSEDEAIRIVEDAIAAGDPRDDVFEWATHVKDNAQMETLIDALLARELAAVDGDPYDTSRLNFLTQILVQDESPEAQAETRALWPNLLAYSAGKWETWRMGAYLARDRTDPWGIVAAMPYHENAVATRGPATEPLMIYLRDLMSAFRQAEGTADEDALRSRIGCAMVKTVRTLDLVCSDPDHAVHDRTCDPSRRLWTDAQALADEPALCPGFDESEIGQFPMTAYDDLPAFPGDS